MTEVRVKATGLAVGGAWVGDVVGGPPEMIGKKAFVRSVVSGEEFRAEVTRVEKSFIVGELTAVDSPSPDRILPPCPVFGRCGGCDLQHLALAAQRDAKLRMVESMLLKQARVSPAKGVRLIGADLPGFEYRRRIALHVSASGEIGFFAEGSGTVVPIDRCPIAREPLNRAFAEARSEVAKEAEDVDGWMIEESEGEIFHVLVMRETTPRERVERLKHSGAAAAISNLKILRTGKVLYEQRRGAPSAPFPSGHFSQVNEEGNVLLQRAVLERITSGEVADLYAGAGNFSLHLARAGKIVTAVEADAALVRFGRARASEAGLSGKVSFVESSCERYLKSASRLPPSLVLDPPRAGAKGVVERAAEKGVKEIVYVSCSLPTLTRDIASLGRLGFLLAEVLVLDMFAQTHHVETISVLTKNS